MIIHRRWCRIEKRPVGRQSARETETFLVNYCGWYLLGFFPLFIYTVSMERIG
jgi:hypothetical protein